MKLLLFSDLHADRNAARALCALAARADLAIGAGDFANAGRGLARAWWCAATSTPARASARIGATPVVNSGPAGLLWDL